MEKMRNLPQTKKAQSEVGKKVGPALGKSGLGIHKRWHVNRNISKPDTCVHYKAALVSQNVEEVLTRELGAPLQKAA
jgi:hypothetical protein